MLAAVEMRKQRRPECDWPSRDTEFLLDREGRSRPGRIRAHAEQPAGVRQQALALQRKQMVEPQAGTLRVRRVARDESHARQHQRVVAWVDHADVWVAPCKGLRIGAQHVVGQQRAAGGHAFEHAHRVGLQAGPTSTERTHQFPEAWRGHRIVGRHQETNAGTFDVVGGDAAAKALRVRAQQRRQRRMRSRNLRLRQLLAVVRDAHRLIGRAVGLVLPHRPSRQVVHVRALIAQCVPVVDQFDLQVHRRAPQHVGRFAAFREETLVQLDAAGLAVVDRMTGIAALEVVDQRLHRDPVRRGEHCHAPGSGRCGRRAQRRQAQQRCSDRPAVHWHAVVSGFWRIIDAATA